MKPKKIKHSSGQPIGLKADIVGATVLITLTDYWRKRTDREIPVGHLDDITYLDAIRYAKARSLIQQVAGLGDMIS